MSSGTSLAALGGHSQAHQEAVFWIAVGVFAGVVFALAVLYRRSRAQVELEEIDAFLEEEQVL